jgi:hypothetical protein
MGGTRLTRRAAALALVACAVLAAGPGDALAQDSDAPPGADPSWLPAEEWVNLLWLPFDEERLEQVLGMTRGEIFRYTRIDATNTLAQLGARRGLDPDRFAAALVAPRKGHVREATYATLLSHARRVVTQGHMAQHFLFHALHQSAIPRSAPQIFGVEDTQQFFKLRRAELSPLQIGELYGRMRVQMRRAAAAALRDAARRGVIAGLLTPRQRDIMIERQLRQLPRWLGQNRYNGPTAGANKPNLPPGDQAKHPAISADGRRVTWDAYRMTAFEAERKGEIHVRTRLVDAGAPASVSAPVKISSRRPYSAYNAVLAPSGFAVAYETAQSTFPAGKRVGQMSVHVRDLRTNRIERISHIGLPRNSAARSAYNPSMSANGRLVAFEATDTPAGRGAQSRNGLWLYDRARRTQTLVAEHGPEGAAFLPKLAGDGSAIAYTDVAPGGDGSTQVYVRAPGSTRAVLASRASGAQGAIAAGDAYDPAISYDGTIVAFVTRAANLGSGANASRVYVRDLRRQTTTLVSATAGADAITPALSRDGRYVAYVARRREDHVDPTTLHASIWLHDRVSGRSWVVSRAAGAAGAVADGYSSEPAISADGARVAFTSTAGNLSPDKPGGLAGVFVRDMRRSTTTLMSERGNLAAQPVVEEPPPLHTAYVCPLEPWHDPEAAAAGRSSRPKVAGSLQPLVPTALAPAPSAYLSG